MRWENKRRGYFYGNETITAEKRLFKFIQDECLKTNRKLHKTIHIDKDNK